MREMISARSVKPALGHVSTYGAEGGRCPRCAPNHERDEDGGRGMGKAVEGHWGGHGTCPGAGPVQPLPPADPAATPAHVHAFALVEVGRAPVLHHLLDDVAPAPAVEDHLAVLVPHVLRGERPQPVCGLGTPNDGMGRPKGWPRIPADG